MAFAAGFGVVKTGIGRGQQGFGVASARDVTTNTDTGRCSQAVATDENRIIQRRQQPISSNRRTGRADRWRDENDEFVAADPRAKQC